MNVKTLFGLGRYRKVIYVLIALFHLLKELVWRDNEGTANDLSHMLKKINRNTLGYSVHH